jgi:TfoX/Sxy family transcriptional regulator of competence genes
MSTRKGFIEFIEDTLNSKQVSTRAMFGEYAIYFDKKVVALVCDNKVFIKINQGSENFFSENRIDLKTGQAYPGSSKFYILTENILENRELFLKILKCVAEFVKVKMKK